LKPIKPSKRTCDVCADGTVCGGGNPKGQTCYCRDVNRDGLFEQCILTPVSTTTTRPGGSTTTQPADTTTTNSGGVTTTLPLVTTTTLRPAPTTVPASTTTTVPSKYPVCTPFQIAGCGVCNSQGTAWTNDDSKCPTGQVCQNWICVPASNQIKNVIDAAGCAEIKGWMCDPNDPATQLWLEFYMDETTANGYLGWTMANINRNDIISQCGGSGTHGFTFSLPKVTQGGRIVADGKAHEIHIVGKKQASDWYIFSQSPETITCPAPTPGGAIIVTSQTDGVTEKSIGACEGDQGFKISDLRDIGIKNYRIWASALRHPWNDEDGVWGSPTIAQIKANPNLIAWSLWDSTLRNTGFRSHGRSLYDMLTSLKSNDITPVLSLKNNWKDVPGLTPPRTDADYNEVWENVFALVYAINVRNDLDINDWEVDNEPDLTWPGTRDEYLKYSRSTYDAIKYVYDKYLPGKSFRFYDPVAGTGNGQDLTWVSESIRQNGDIIDVVDWHHYVGSSAGDAAQIRGWINRYGVGQKELYLSEWGTYWGGYESHDNAMVFGKYLMEHSLVEGSYIDSSAIFSLYDWGKPGQSTYMPGLITQNSAKTRSYYAFRMVTRAFQGSKTRYVLQNVPSDPGLLVAATRGGGKLYLTVYNNGGTTRNFAFDVSAHKTSGGFKLRKYSSVVNDEIIGNPTFVNGIISVTSESGTITQVEV